MIQIDKFEQSIDKMFAENSVTKAQLLDAFHKANPNSLSSVDELNASNCKNVTVRFDIDKLKIINEKLNDTYDERAGHDSWKSDEFEEFCDMINTAIENYVK